MASVDDLSRTLATIWDRMQRLFPKTQHRKVLRWHLQTEEVDIREEIGIEGRVKQVAYPAYWADVDPSYEKGNIKWGEGQWA